MYKIVLFNIDSNKLNLLLHSLLRDTKYSHLKLASNTLNSLLHSLFGYTKYSHQKLASNKLIVLSNLSIHKIYHCICCRYVF